MFRLLIFTAFLFGYNTLWSQSQRELKSYYDSLVDSKRSYVYTVLIGDDPENKALITQTAFKVAGFNGLITPLHGFFKYYSIDTVELNLDLYRILLIRDFTHRPVFDSDKVTYRVTQVDLYHDLAFIEIDHTNLMESDGFTADGRDSLDRTDFNSVMYSISQNGVIGTLTVPLRIQELTYYNYLDNLESNALKNVYLRLKIPNAFCKVKQFDVPNKPGQSGAPLVDRWTGSLYSFVDMSSWRNLNTLTIQIPDRDSLLKSFKIIDSLSDEEKNILKNAHRIHERDVLIAHPTLRFTGGEAQLVDDSPILSNKEGDSYKSLLYSIPESYKYYLDSSNISDLQKLYHIFFSSTTKNQRKVFNRFTRDYPLTLNFLRSAYRNVVFHYRDSIAFKNAFKSLVESPESAVMSKSEKKAWAKSGLIYQSEKRELMNQMALKMNKMLSKDLTNEEKVQLGDSSAIEEYNRNLVTRLEKLDSLEASAHKKFNNEELIEAREDYIEASSLCNYCDDILTEIARIDSIIMREPADLEVTDSLGIQMTQIFTNFKNRSLINDGISTLEFDVRVDSSVDSIFVRINAVIARGNDSLSSLNAIYRNFPPQKYLYHHGNVANQVISDGIKVMTEVLNINLDSSSIKLTVSGYADALPYTGKFQYSETDFGDLSDYMIENLYDSTDVESLGKRIKGTSIDKNIALAFLRAYGVYFHLKKELPQVAKNFVKIEAAQNKKEGSEHRYINLKFEIGIKK